MGKSFIDLFEEQVAKTPGSIALVFEKEKLSYHQLNERANQLANYLRDRGVRDEALVPLFIERGIDMLVAIIGIMKAGGAYVPIDTDFPAERISYMLQDTAAGIMVSSPKSKVQLPGNSDIEIVVMDDLLNQPSSNLPTRPSANHLAYVIYTSGSTGMPKGVMVEHGNLVDYITGLAEKTQIDECRSFALVSTIATDLGNTVIYPALSSGGALHIFTKEFVSNIEMLHDYFDRNAIDCLKIVPSHWKALAMDDRLLLPGKLLVFGGEALQEKLVEEIRSAGTRCRIVNHYGPTETTIGKLLHVVEPEMKYEYTVPIGKPFSKTRVLILTKNLKLCPIGVPGQLFIAGDGVARGYLNNPELTKEKFLPNPYAKEGFEVMYSTGDMVKYLADGNVSFIGRADNQVKIRGYRVELGEIENILHQCDCVSQAVVLAKEDKQDNKRLVAYIVPQGDFNKEAVLHYLKEKLPEYMIPAVFVEQESLPLTANGKVDRNALPDPDSGGEQSKEYVAPRNEIEAKLAALWEGVLEEDQVGMNDDFFELGGHSLLAVRLVSAIRKAFAVEMPISDIFDYPTVALLAQQLANNTDTAVVGAIQAITPRPARIPLSFSQERLWFIDHLEGSVQYHVPAVLRLKGNLDKEALVYTLQQVVNRHEVLRTVIRDEAGVPFQFIKEKDGWQMTFTSGSEYKEDPARLQNYVQQIIKKPFDLSKDYLLRAELITIASDDFVLVVTMHHIASDAWSTPVLVNEVVELYRSFLEKRPPTLAPLGIQYADYAIWQRNYLQGDVLKNKLDYWKQKLQDVPVLEMPLDHDRPPAGSIRGAALNFRVDKQLADQLLDLGQQQGTTLFMTMLASFNVLLSRYSGQQDICVGTSIANRTQQEMESLLGFFVNTLALRSEVLPGASFIELLQQVKSTTLDAYAHQDVPFEKVVEAVVKERDNSRSPLFQVMLVLRNTAEAGQLTLGEVTLSGMPYELTTSKFDLTFFITETANGLLGSVQFCPDIYNGQTIHRMMAHFKALLASIVAAPHQGVSALQLLTHTEQDQLLNEMGLGGVDYPTGKSVVDLFREQVNSAPGSIAVVFGDTKLSYRELDEKSDHLARLLTSRGVTEDTLVPLYLERGCDMVVGLLGIMKAGAAYVPIDTEFPADRIRYMLDDTKATIIVTNKVGATELVTATGVEILDIGNLPTDIPSDILRAVKPNQLAYVIYTSGSTGKPKGVMIEHRSLVDYYYGLKQAIGVTGCKSFALVSTLATDLGNTVIYGSLLSGGTLHVFSKDAVSDTEFLHRYFRVNKIDCLKIVPSHWKALCMEDQLLLPSTLLVFGGEALQAGIVEDIRISGTKCRVVNHYGPTETTIGKLLHLVDQDCSYGRTIPIGKPFSNTRVRILSVGLQLCPVGVPGQLFIAGDGVARGYFNNVALTSEKFIKDPFSKNAYAVMYGTGDLVRYLADGNIEFIGRVDDQVKIRGYRIELGEIESILQQHEMISNAVVLVKEDKQGNKRLVAYTVTGGWFNRDEIVSWLKERLPDYMVPAGILQMDSMPLTANGKIDRKVLPDPEAMETTGNQYMPPRTDTEEILVAIWQDVLDIERVGIYDNFFELGGDSIISIQVVSRARRAGCDFQVADVFTYQTVAALAEHLQERTEANENTGEQALLTGAAGLLPVQQWYFEKRPAEISHFNQAVLLAIDKAATGSMLKTAFQHLVMHHDALRFTYRRENENWLQEYGAAIGELVTIDLGTADADSFRPLLSEQVDRIQRSLDIEKGQLCKFVLIKTPAAEIHNRLLLVVHHLAVDGVSWRVMLEDLELALTKLQADEPVNLGEKTSSYRQWYQALETYSTTNRLLNQREYWANAVTSFKPLPADKDYHGIVKQKDKAAINVRLGKADTKRLLQDVPKVYHTEINDLLLTALAKTIAAWADYDKVLIGMEGHGREAVTEGIDTSRTVGWFTTHYPLQIDVSGAYETWDFIKTVKEQLRKVPDKGIGFGVLKYIGKDEALQGRQPWDIIFNYLGQLDNVVKKSKWLSPAGESAGTSTSEEYGVAEKLWVNAAVRDEEMVFSWTYSTHHFNEATLQELAANFISNLALLVSHCMEKQLSGEPAYTPTDFGLGADISYKELDAFLNERVDGESRFENVEAMYRLSGLQQGILFHGLFDGKGEGYINHFWADLINPDIHLLSKSWNELLKRHSILRSTFYHDTFRIPVQCVYREMTLPIEVIDFRGLDENEKQTALEQHEASDLARGFDFRTGPLMRISLMRLDQERYRMLWTSHHILFDGWSRSIMMGEFLKVYGQLLEGETLPAVQEDRYEDYIRYIEKNQKEDEERYWKNYLSRLEQGTLLPFINTAANRNKGQGKYGSEILHLDQAITANLEQFAQQHRITMNTLVQGVWAYLLHQYTGNDDIVFGVIVSGRPDDLSHVEQRIGMYINTLPLHSHFDRDQPVINWLQGLQADQVSSRKYQYTPLPDIQHLSGVRGDLFDSLFVFENYPVSKVLTARKWSLKVENVLVNEQSNYPLTLLIHSGADLRVNFSYNQALLAPGIIRQISGHFENVLIQLADATDQRLQQIKLITPAEERMLQDFNQTASEYPPGLTVVDLLEKQAAQTPTAIAIIHGDKTISYKELHEQANQVAHFLQSRGIGKESLVPVCVERGIEMVVGILGILKAGAAYVPMDPEYPADRLKYMLEDTGSRIVITSQGSNSKLPVTADVEVIDLNSDWPVISTHSTANLQVDIRLNQLAYVIYTSGSTGKPKGVMIDHGNAYTFINWCKQAFAQSKFDIAYATTSICFDLSVFELFYPMSVGKSIRVIESGMYIGKYLPGDTNVLVNTVPSVMQYLLSEGTDLTNISVLNMAGEPIPLQVQKSLDADKMEIRNLYGPTEDTTYSTVYRLRNGEPALIGKPISNTQVYIVDKAASLVPPGVPGEICLAGAGLARGYLNQPALTGEKFIANPFSHHAGDRLYKTGDLGKWLPDGNIAYLGRLDDQVKIRGFRIELGEVESAISETGLVNQCVVLAREGKSGSKRLVAYIVPGDGFNKQELVSLLEKKLPGYMVPDSWLELEKMPLTPNGKINKKALPDADAAELLQRSYVAPRNDLERTLADIWQDLLKVERVGINDNFFELGGHSLLVMRMVSAIQKKLLVSIPINLLFQFTTIDGLSKFLEIEMTPEQPEDESVVFDQIII